jgi:hypothetical protein
VNSYILAMSDAVMLHTCLDLSYTGTSRAQYNLGLTGAELAIACAKTLNVQTDPERESI